MKYKDPGIIDVRLMNEKERSFYFHEMAGGSRLLELLLCTCFNYKIVPSVASSGNVSSNAYIMVLVEQGNLDIVGRLIDLVMEIPGCEFRIRTMKHEKMYAELSCDFSNSDYLFTRMKEIIEESRIEVNKHHNYTVMMTIYNIFKIVSSIIEADLIFTTDDNLYTQGKCFISFYQGNQINRLSSRKKGDINLAIQNLKETASINLPAAFCCTFEELRSFYFELDEAVYGSEE